MIGSISTCIILLMSLEQRYEAEWQRFEFGYFVQILFLR